MKMSNRKTLLKMKARPSARPSARDVLRKANELNYRLPQTALAKYNGGNTSGFLDDVLEWAGLIPGAEKYVSFIKEARKHPLVNKVERKFRSALGYPDSAERAAIVKEEKKEIIKEAIKTGSRKIQNISRVPRVLRSNAKVLEETGCEPLKLLTTGSGWESGKFIYSCKINPTTMDCPKLKRVAKGWEKYSLSGEFKLKGGAGTDVPGTYIMYIDYDPDDNPDQTSTGQINVQRAMSHKPTASGAAFDEAVLAIKRANEPGLLYLDNDATEERFTSVGTFYMVCVTPFPASVTLGMLYFNWRIKMEIPQEDPGVPTGDCWLGQFGGTFDSTHILGTTTVVSDGTIDINLSERNTGYITVPPGSFYITAQTGFGTDQTYSTGHAGTCLSPAVTASYARVTKYPVEFVSPRTFLESQFVTSPGNFRIYTPHYPGTVTILIWVFAINIAVELSHSWKSACKLIARATSAKAQTANVDRVISLMSNSSSNCSSTSSSTIQSWPTTLAGIVAQFRKERPLTDESKVSELMKKYLTVSSPTTIDLDFFKHDLESCVSKYVTLKRPEFNMS